jgi:UDP-N-acetylmuramoyl-L-alanyl-D-glutamate--2,6-diaminopimelate ligase
MTNLQKPNLKVTLEQVANAIHAEDITASNRDDLLKAVVDVTHDSRQVRDGWLFVAVRGANVDANRFVAKAREQGAVGIVSEDERPMNFDGVWLRVPDARRALAQASAETHRHPSRELNLVGITGTNGKTTTTYLIAEISRQAGEPVAMTGTVEYIVGSTRRKAERTTPEACDTQRILRQAVAAGCRTAVMECSSQAIDLHRCDGLYLHTAIFTNLTRDHLDYHHTMDAYFAAKRKLFDGSLSERPRNSIINTDDERGRELVRELKESGASVVTYALNDTQADVTAHDLELSLAGMSLRVRTDAGERLIRSPLVGRPHAYNILAAIAAGRALGYEMDVIERAISRSAGAPGRFERVPHEGDFAVVVDYAHTDDALLNVLQTARSVAGEGRIITVFGCGGDRDPSKRAPMGHAAGSLSDIVILTSDNPRTEDPEKILSDVEKGLGETGKPYRKIPDRRAAIHEAVSEARAGDVVIIAGKGHEDYQIIGRETFHFDDREVAREALSARSN